MITIYRVSSRIGNTTDTLVDPLGWAHTIALSLSAATDIADMLFASDMRARLKLGPHASDNPLTVVIDAFTVAHRVYTRTA